MLLNIDSYILLRCSVNDKLINFLDIILRYNNSFRLKDEWFEVGGKVQVE